MTGPYRPTGLRAEDRSDFEAVLRLALDTPEIRDVLGADPTGLAVRRLRVRALADADEIVAAAGGEYRAYLAVVASAAGAGRAEEGAGEADGRTWRRAADAELLPLVAVLTPLLAGSAAAVVLVLGHLLRLTGVQGPLPGSLVSAGWTLALFAVTSALLAFAALFRTAIRGSTTPDGSEQARLAWQQALLKRGMLPHLRRRIHEERGGAEPGAAGCGSAEA
ncbi:hypothetical protein [Streptomyces adelaidensis]|uniref:hypothetical protein n=1 Tax=Streptomyces adelaidensis TaxID=2796465 RepID=UPI0019056FAD|nr:hypothetical protein [Streptomyces adelaidensis]